MSTPETVKAQLRADIAAANEATGKQDATMHDAVASLIEGFGGEDGEDGGYYTPVVSQPDSETMQVSFSPSKASMENVQPVSVLLPHGPAGDDGKDYVLTEDDKQDIAEIAAGMVEVPDSGGNVDLTGYAKEQWVEEGYQPKGEYALKKDIPSVPVKSVNGKDGDVHLSASDVGARSSDWMPTAQEVGALPSTYMPPNQTAEQVGADPKGTAASEVSQHNTADDSHGDIRLLIAGLTNRLNALANSTDTDLDQMAELVAYIKNNKSLIDGITTGKVSVSDIVNNLTTNVANKPLSAAQGVALKTLIDAITIPTKLSQLTNDKGYITGYTETDPTVPAWAKNATKPSYSKSEVGLGNVDNVKQYSASNPPPYPVTSVNGKTGAVSLDAAAVGARPSTWMPSASDVGALPASTAIPTKVGQLENDKGYLTEHQDISGKLDTSALPTAINTALAQAKSSGEFDGEVGATGPVGPQGDSGVYIGEEEPTDASVKVWIKPDGESDAEGGIPAYVKEEAENVADRVIATRTINSLVLLMASDIHVSPNGNARTAIQHMGAGMAELRNTISPDGVMLLGDYNYGQEPQSIAQGIESMKLCRSYVSEATKGVPTVWLNGNHDYYGIADNEYRLPDDMVYALVGSHNTANAVVDADNVGRNYGYVDFEKQRIRLVYLNTTDINGAAYTSQLISTTQGQWLINTALDLTAKGEDEEKWGVVVCSHFPAFLNPQLPAVLGAFKDKTSGSNFGVSYNFATAKAELIATFHGHIHNLKVTDMPTSGGNTIKAICIPNAVPGRENPYTGEQQEVDSEGNAVSYPKTAGTAEDTSFCAVVIDRDNKTVHAICYGAGYDREIVYGEEEAEVEIVNQIPISTDTSGAIYKGVGYADGVRIGSDGTDRTGAPTDATGFMPCKFGDKVYFSGCQIYNNTSYTYQELACYDSSKTFLGLVNLMTLSASLLTKGENDNITMIDTSGFAEKLQSLAFIRIAGQYIGADSIITINQPIA